MRALPLDFGVLHFVGIGGIGMSGIAEVLHTLGYRVQGSDLADNANARRLRKMGIPVFVGHAAEHLGDARAVVISSAVKADNPEVREARARSIPVVRRADMLAELMRLKWAVAVGGTHGKTTTTSLIAAVLDTAGLDPTIVNGGIINALGTNARVGAGDWAVIEADESDGTFTRLPATVAVVTNIDPEHLDFYGDFETAKAAFKTFVENVPFYGFAVLCVDHPEVQALISKVSDRRVVTYGFSPQADVRGVNLSFDAAGAHFEAVVSDRRSGETATLKDLSLSMPGEHNVLNALAAVAVGTQMKIDAARIRAALAGFSGVKRRFTKTGVVDGVTVIDDYGHHRGNRGGPESGAPGGGRASGDRGGAAAPLFPPAQSVRRFLRLPRRRRPGDRRRRLRGGRSADRRRRPRCPGRGAARPWPPPRRTPGRPDSLASMIRDAAQPGDLVVCLGAGSISQWANALPAQLQALKGGDA
jgi:UDP-N-acetylmuramate--alanine ligase